jgi:hypothetical protein
VAAVALAHFILGILFPLERVVRTSNAGEWLGETRLLDTMAQICPIVSRREDGWSAPTAAHVPAPQHTSHLFTRSHPSHTPPTRCTGTTLSHTLLTPAHTHPSEPPLPQPTLHSAARPRASSAPAARPSSTAVRSTSAFTGRRAGTRRSAPRQVRPGPGPPGPPRPASNSTSSPSLPSTWLRRRS